MFPEFSDRLLPRIAQVLGLDDQMIQGIYFHFEYDDIAKCTVKLLVSNEQAKELCTVLKDYRLEAITPDVPGKKKGG